MRWALPFALLGGIINAAPTLLSPDEVGAAAPGPITGVLNNLNGGIMKTEKDISNWKGDASGADLILQDSIYLLGDLRSGSLTVAAAKQVSIFDRPDWLQPAYNLDRNLDKLATVLISKKSQFDKAGRTKDVIGQLLQIKPATDELVRQIFTKLPGASQLLARPVSNEIVGKVDKVINAYQAKSWNPFVPKPSSPKPPSPSSSGQSWGLPASGPSGWGPPSAPQPSGSGWGPPSVPQPSASEWGPPSQPPTSASEWGPPVIAPPANAPPVIAPPASAPPANAPPANAPPANAPPENVLPPGWQPVLSGPQWTNAQLSNSLGGWNP